jgi:anti-sigma regulatory factor (Ser/Thr protein kinase)
MERRLASDASSVGEARRVLRAAVTDAEAGDAVWVDDAEVAVSEIVTNALVHAGTPIELTVRVDDARLRVEVADGSRQRPQARGYAVTAGTGRGLTLVEELVRRWGADVSDVGKVVWFEIGTAGTGAPTGSASFDPTPGGAGRDAIEVVLLGVPLLMHAAWQEHAATLLREYLLAQFDDETEDAGLFEAHAAASDAMSVLFEQIPAPHLEEDPEARVASAAEPGGTAARVVLRMSAAAADSFRRLDELLDAAVALADARRWLTVPTRPELRALRRWLCAQVRDQRLGAAPQPWQLPARVGATTC